MKFKKTEENQVFYAHKNIRVNSKHRRHIQKNIQIGAKLFTFPNSENLNKTFNYKSYYRPISLNISRCRRLSAQEGTDNCSPTRAYYSDSETVVRKEKESSYRSQKNLFSENEINIASIQNENITSLTTEHSDYLSSDSSYPLIKEYNSSGISSDIYQVANSNAGNHQEVVMKRFSLRESSTSLFCSNLIDLTKLSSVERSPSLQHIGCSSIESSPFFRTPISTISGNCDHLTATTASSCVSCSSGYSHSGVFNTGYSSDDFHLSQHNQLWTSLTSNEQHTICAGGASFDIMKRTGDQYFSTSSSWISENNRNVNVNSFNQPHILSLDVDLPRQQNYMLNSGDSNNGMEDLSAYMDLMIHIPKMHL